MSEKINFMRFIKKVDLGIKNQTEEYKKEKLVPAHNLVESAYIKAVLSLKIIEDNHEMDYYKTIFDHVKNLETDDIDVKERQYAKILFEIGKLR